MKPDSKRIEEYAKSYRIVPICKEIYADVITPISLLRRLRQEGKRYFLLESVEGGENWGRYSFLGYNPIVCVTCKDNVVKVEGEQEKTVETNDPMQVLREILKEYEAPKIPDLPPFTGGFVGYFSYSMMQYAEPSLNFLSSDFYDFEVMLFDKVIAFDHLQQKINIVVNMKTDQVLANYGKAVEQIDRIVQMIHNQSPLPVEKVESNPKFTCNVTKEAYKNSVLKAKEYIKDGDIFQVVPSRVFASPYKDDLIHAYRVLRTTNPSPYMVYMQTDDVQLMCSSPETLVKRKDQRLSTFPVAGSRPRGKDSKEDENLVNELKSDEKELAEHNMLVDLARNDIGKIAKFNSVEVTDYMMIHKYSKIMHLASTVEGDIKDGCDAFDAIEAILPAGTLSGAPKIRACEIIEELEKTARGIYGGAIGYIDFTGNMDVCIAIRMAVKKNETVYVQAGGGVVADSIPENEYVESFNKAKAVMQAIERAGEVEER